MNDHTHRGVYLNNQAVAYLQAGDIRGSMELLRTALATVKSELTSYSQQTSMARQDSLGSHKYRAKDYSTGSPRYNQKTRAGSLLSTSTLSDLRSPGSDLGDGPFGQADGSKKSSHYCHFGQLIDSCNVHPLIQSAPIFTREQRQEQDIGCFASSSSPPNDTSFLPVFARALIIPTSSCEEHNHPDFLAAVVLYNIGLVSHVQGIVLGQSSHSLRKALHCYDTALLIVERSVQQRPQQQQTQGTEQTYLLSLAILYNSAQIHAHFFALQKMQSCLSRVQELLHFAQGADGNCRQEHQARHRSLVRHYQDDYAYFYINVMVLCAPRGLELMFAPAA